jgi:hypothetical protein
MLPDFVAARAERLDALHAARSPAESLARHGELLTAVAECLGIDRLPRSEARVQSVGVVERDAYTIEKVVFEALPGLPVPAVLY